MIQLLTTSMEIIFRFVNQNSLLNKLHFRSIQGYKCPNKFIATQGNVHILNINQDYIFKYIKVRNLIQLKIYGV
jgi:hypothetical protein